MLEDWNLSPDPVCGKTGGKANSSVSRGPLVERRASGAVLRVSTFNGFEAGEGQLLLL